MLRYQSFRRTCLVESEITSHLLSEIDPVAYYVVGEFLEMKMILNHWLLCRQTN